MLMRWYTYVFHVLKQILSPYTHAFHFFNQAQYVMLGPFCIVVLLIMYLLDLCHHVDMLSLYIFQHLVAFGVCIIMVSQLAEDIVKCGPDANIIILLSRMVSGRGTCKSVGPCAVYAHVVGCKKVGSSCSISSNSSSV